jgi:hypothetical protein
MNDLVYVGAGVLMIMFFVSIGLFFVRERKDFKALHLLALVGIAVAIMFMVENYTSLYDYIHVGILWLDPFIGLWVYGMIAVTAVFTANYFTSGSGWQ